MDRAESRAKILVVDDNAQNRDLVAATLEPEGHEVILVANGDDALAEFASKAVDCVLLDVRMPGLDGFAVCERMRKSPGGADIPILFLTALRDVDTFDRALHVGGDDFLMKPVRPTELLVRVQAALRLRRLSTEIRMHYDLVRQQRNDLVRLQLQKEMLMSFVIHDLKNPVAAMDMLAQVLGRDRSLPEDAREIAQQIRDSARHLMRLIYNLLDLSKSEEGKLLPNRESVDLRALMNSVCESFEAHARECALTMEVVVEVSHVIADKDLLQRVLGNLTENAMRHAPRSSVVQLQAKRVNGGVELRVVDRGPGIPEEMRERVFERYVQLNTSAAVATRGGRGLGLNFCKVAIEAHGGRIWIEDAMPGTALCITVPDVE